MKVQFLNAQRRNGKSAKTGNDYDICEVEYLVPLKSKQTSAYNFVAYGNRAQKMAMLPEGMGDFTDKQSCDWVELALEPDPERPQFNRCTGLVKAK